MIDLKAKPFYLDDEACKWVNNTLASLSEDEKIGQLFCDILWDKPGSEPLDLLKDVQPGGVMYRPFAGEKMLEYTKTLQANSKIPMLIACNLERGGSGGNGGLTNGTYVASPMGASATNDPHMEYLLGKVAAEEGAACGINLSFEPIIDIDKNPENPITNVRTFGSNPDKIIAMAKAYADACKEKDIAVTIKHFPGDGVDFRDQHLMSSVNSLSADEWLATYGKIYQELINYGAQCVMSAHIMQPSLTKLVNPDIKDEDILPGSLSKELNQGILRERFGFNGVIITDATQMVGFTCSMPRWKAVPTTIEHGADIFLFTINQKEDFNYMKAGLKNGLLSQKRLDEAVTRILALKASLGLHKNKEYGSEKELIKVLRCDEHIQIARDVANKCVTLVKDTQNLLPLSVEKHKKVKLIQCTNERLDSEKYLPELLHLKEMLELEGFDVSFYNDCVYPGVNKSLADFKKETDLIIYYANMKVGSNQTTIRLTWDDFLGEDSPKYVLDIPTLFLSFSNPYHLTDVPMVKTLINAYTSNNETVNAVVEKIMGRSDFMGVSPVDPFCGLWGTRL